MDGAFGMKPLCILTSDTSPDRIQRMGGARINLVIRHEDFIAAQVREAETLSAQCGATLSHLLREHADALKLSLGGHVPAAAILSGTLVWIIK
jgi:hypothetical protein